MSKKQSMCQFPCDTPDTPNNQTSPMAAHSQYSNPELQVILEEMKSSMANMTSANFAMMEGLKHSIAELFSTHGHDARLQSHLQTLETQLLDCKRTLDEKNAIIQRMEVIKDTQQLLFRSLLMVNHLL
jgi:hypothetical protein